MDGRDGRDQRPDNAHKGIDAPSPRNQSRFRRPERGDTQWKRHSEADAEGHDEHRRQGDPRALAEAQREISSVGKTQTARRPVSVAEAALPIPADTRTVNRIVAIE